VSGPRDQEPQGPLFQRDDRLGELLREANRELSQNIDARRAFIALDEKLERRKRAPWRAPAMALASGALVLGTFCALKGPYPGALTAGVRLEPDTQVATAPDTRVFSAPERKASMGNGKTLLPDGSAMQVSAEGRVHWHEGTGGVLVRLERGDVRCKVSPQRAGKRFVVEAGDYAFVAEGHELEVASKKDGPHLRVHGGRVEVHRGRERVAVVNAGESWSPADSRASEPPAQTAHHEAPKPAPEERKAEPVSAPAPLAAEDCAAKVKAQAFAQAATCYEKQSQGKGLSAEFALFELSRLRLSALNDAAGAVRALEEHQRRFATGALAHQVQVALARARAQQKRDAKVQALP
jgi:hypothetical protein